MPSKVIAVLVLLVFLVIGCKSRQGEVSNEGSASVTFQSDRFETFRKLEKLQGVVYKNNPNAFVWTGSAEDMSLLLGLYKRHGIGKRKGRKYIRRSMDTIVLPTRHQNLIEYLILIGVQREVEADLQGFIRKKPKVGLGTLPYWSLNAKSFPVDDEEIGLVVFNSGVFNFCHEMVKILLETIRIEAEGNKNVIIDYSDEYLEQLISSGPDIFVRFSKALEDYSNNRNVKGQAPPEGLKEPLLTGMVEVMEYFVLAHEYGHVIFNHKPSGTDALEFRKVSLPERPANEIGTPEMRSVRSSWEQEIECDLFAMAMLERFLDRKYGSSSQVPLRAFMLTVPSLFFKLSHIAKASKSIYADQTRITELPSETIENCYSASNQMINRAIAARSTELSRLNPVPGINSQPTSALPDGFHTTHPPDIVRSRYMEHEFFSIAKNDPMEDKFGEMGLKLSENLEIIWTNLVPVLYRIIEDQE